METMGQSLAYIMEKLGYMEVGTSEDVDLEKYYGRQTVENKNRLEGAPEEERERERHLGNWMPPEF